jgi:hypothetical protein
MIYSERQKEGFVRVRKVIITPTRMLFVAPELLMGNRVLRTDPENYPPDRFLRVIFRDDNGTHVHSNNVGDKVIDNFIQRKLVNGIEIAGRHFNYLGSSNSQLRDSGCYFLEASQSDILEFRKNMGQFKMQSVPKMMARLGQCFTQAREASFEFEREAYADGYDYQGGCNKKKEPYTFSDGVGKISFAMAKKISKSLELNNCVPSCFQIRFRGYKGVLVVDMHLDELANWGRLNGIRDDVKVRICDGWLNIDFYFRPSQKKFKAKRDKKIEIVKYSAPTPVCLNRPMINILDQVSQLQSPKLHQRMCRRVHCLLDQHLHNLTRSLIEEQRARNRLAEFPKLIMYEMLTDINLTQEPFFRSLLRGSARATLKRLRQKLQIPIPTSLGR